MTYVDVLQTALRHHRALPTALGALRAHGASPAAAAQPVCAVTGATNGGAAVLV